MKEKISIIGMGKVGSTAAFVSARKELGDLILVNRTEGIAKGIALDNKESLPLSGCDINIKGTSDFREIKDSKVIVVTAGVPRKPGMSRDDLIGVNCRIVEDICKKIKEHSKDAVIIIVSNPLDAMVYAAKKVGNFKKNKIVGMAGILDSIRFRSFIAERLKISIEDVNALVLGGHSDFMIPLPKHTSVNGVPLDNIMDNKMIDEVVARTKNAGAEILRLEKESSAYYGPGASAAEMIEAVVKDKKRVLPCAAYLDGEYGVKGIFMGVPIKLGKNGIEEILSLKLNRAEMRSFLISAKKIKELNKIVDNML